MKNKSKSMRNENNCNKLHVLKLTYFSHKKAFEDLSERQVFFSKFFLFSLFNCTAQLVGF